LDTIDITYTSEDCTSKLAAPIVFDGQATTFAMPTEVTFNDPVSPALEDVTKAVQITPMFSGAGAAQISTVSITGPFTTSLVANTALTSGTPVDATVTFRPSQMPADGPATGTLSFTVNQCSDAYTIDLKAQRTVVSVQEDLVRGLPFAWLDGHNLQTSPQDVGVLVLDIQGSLVTQRSAGSTESIHLSEVATGAYFVVLQDLSGKRHFQTVLISR
jgi:hypothetical protein